MGLTGCGGSSTASLTTIGYNYYLYQPNSVSGTVSAYSMNATSGVLTTIGTTSVGSSPYSAVSYPSGAYLYVANFGNATILAFQLP